MRIGLLDHMGYGNLGDAATQDVVIANIKKRISDAEIVGFSLVPLDTTTRHSIPCYPIRRSNPAPEIAENPAIRDQFHSWRSYKSRARLGLKNIRLVYVWAKPLANFVREALFWVRSYRILRNIDLLVISGGGQLDDLWPDQPYTVFKFALLARLARKKVYFLNIGVGPLRNPTNRWFARWAVRLANYRSVRDHDSQERLLQFGVRSDTKVYPDVVYGLELADPVEIIRPRIGKVTIGINPVGFCDPRVWPKKDVSSYDAYLEKITCFAHWLLAEGYNLRIFTTDINVDRYAIADLKAKLHSKSLALERVDEIFPTPGTTVKDVLRQMAGYDVIVTSKFHGIIFSHVLGKPVISLSYHRKMDFAMRAVGHSRFSADVAHFRCEWLIDAFCALIDDGRRIQSECAKAVETNAATLSRQFDGLFLTKWCASRGPSLFKTPSTPSERAGSSEARD